jgi:hypothetical protein
MISDSPYQFKGLALTVRAGAVAGVAGALIMVGVLAVLQPVSGLPLSWVLGRIGRVILPASVLSGGNTTAQWVGLGLQVVLGAVLGVLYATSQQRIPAPGMMAVGIFYGFLLWVVGSVLVGFLFEKTLRAALRSWPWLLACLVYGMSLAGAAIWTSRRRPSEGVAPKD